MEKSIETKLKEAIADAIAMSKGADDPGIACRWADVAHRHAQSLNLLANTPAPPSRAGISKAA